MDQIDRAIAASEQEPEGQMVPAIAMDVRLPNGRPVRLVIPADLTPGEALDLVGWIGTAMPQKLIEARAKMPAPPPTLAIARAMPTRGRA